MRSFVSSAVDLFSSRKKRSHGVVERPFYVMLVSLHVLSSAHGVVEFSAAWCLIAHALSLHMRLSFHGAHKLICGFFCTWCGRVITLCYAR